jgi:hypothetical protein
MFQEVYSNKKLPVELFNVEILVIVTVAVYVRLICPSVVDRMTNNSLLTVNPLYFLKHRLYTLLPCTSASHFASVQRREAI